MANAAMVKDRSWARRIGVGIYYPGVLAEIIADENSIVGQSRAPAQVTVTAGSAMGTSAADIAAQMMGVLSASRSKEAYDFAEFFSANVVLTGSAYSTVAVDPFEFKSVPPKETRLVSVTVKSMGRAVPLPFEE